MGSPRESVPESLESASTAASKMYDVSLSPNGEKNGSMSPPKMVKPPRLITRAKIAEITSSYANSVKEMVVNFSAKGKKMYANSKQKFLTDGSHIDGSKKESFDLSKWYPAWFVQANPLMKLTIGMALFFVTLFLIVIVAVSKSGNPQAIQSDGSSLVDMTSLSSVLNDTAVKSLDTAVDSSEHVVAETSMPSYAPTFSPSATPTGDESNYCIDKVGSFATSRGKSRDCSWLKLKHLERECGGLGEEPSELGLNCKLSCRDYNDCVAFYDEETDSPTASPTSITTSKPTSNRRKKKDKTPQPTNDKTTTTSTQMTLIEDEDEVYFIDVNNKLRPCTWLDIRNPAVRAKRRDENCPNAEVQEVCPVACLDYVDFTITTTVAATVAAEDEKVDEEEEDMYFADSDGEQRSCSWLDVRNAKQRTKRRDVNCAKITVQILCPESCEEYDAIPVTLNKQTRDIDVASDVSASNYVRSHDLVPQDQCYDRAGYFLNELGHPKQCSWLTENADEVDLRREMNCGENALTDLGAMCKSSCGFGGIC